MEKSDLKGTWKLSSFNYSLADGKPDESVKIKNAVRIYNDTHFSVFYEYENGKTETCITNYQLEGEKLTLKILHHTEPGMAGNVFTAITKVSDNKMTHEMNMDGYQIKEVYERIG
ncbi:MAG: lipocalin family protein [Mariniphaga sp.]|nr:lipocalin family protein [Mariniphaga sp.]